MLDFVRVALPTDDSTVIGTHGIDYGGPVYILHFVGNNLILRKPAYTVWESRGQTGTDPARLMIGTLFKDKDGNHWLAFFWEKETGKAWRAVRAEAYEIASTKEGKLPKWGFPIPKPFGNKP